MKNTQHLKHSLSEYLPIATHVVLLCTERNWTGIDYYSITLEKSNW